MNPQDLELACLETPIRVGRYDVLGHINTGGMGAVYRAVDREHNTEVALKTLNHLSPNSLLRFKNEFRKVVDLSHPNLVELYELGMYEGLWYFTMERIEGQTFIEHIRGKVVVTPRLNAPTLDLAMEDLEHLVLDERYVERKPSVVASTHKLRDALEQVVSGVGALHGAGLLHLDLKPSNVLVNSDGRVVILDFGLIRPIDPEANAPETISGTPSTMAPEQHTGKGISPASDWYAVGLMLYEALTGVGAFEADGMTPSAYAKQNFLPSSPRQLLPDLPQDLSDLTMMLLQAEPSRRPDETEIFAWLNPELREESRAPVRQGTKLIGRLTERRELQRSLVLAISEGTAIVELAGPSGVGKTALLNYLVKEAEPHALVLQGRCYERETVPFKAFDALLDMLALHLSSEEIDTGVLLPRWTSELVLAFPVLGRVPCIAKHADENPPNTDSILELRRRAIEGLRELFVNLAARAPLVLMIDDLQWVDHDSSGFLERLLEAPAPEGLLLVNSFRDEEVGQSPAGLSYIKAFETWQGRADLQCSTVAVSPLESVQAEELATLCLSELGVEVEGLATTIAEESGGLPFFVEELAHYASERCEEEALADLMVLHEVLAERVGSLAPLQRQMVEALAVANSPIPLSVAFAASGMEGEGVLRALWSLQQGHFVRSSGGNADDLVELHHDRMRESVVASLSESRLRSIHFELGSALFSHVEETGQGLFGAVRHLNAAAELIPQEIRLEVARLNLRAGKHARQAVGFPLALDCFLNGIEFLPEDAWESSYELSLALHNGAADAAQLTKKWDIARAHVLVVKQHAKNLVDQIPVWMVEIDVFIAHYEFDRAVDSGLEVLRFFGVDLPNHPQPAEVKASVQRAMSALESVGPQGMRTHKVADDLRVITACRLLTHISSPAYFGRPALFPVIAAELVVTGVEEGISPATSYALSVFGIVLNSLEEYEAGYAWGQVALALIPRFQDRSLEGRTGHCVHNLVCNFIVPLGPTIQEARDCVEVAKSIGDVEYAGYSLHTVAHNSFYSGAPLEAIYEEMIAATEFMDKHQLNSFHVHMAFERLLACFTGRSETPETLDDDSFNEVAYLAEAEVKNSGVAMCSGRVAIGLSRYFFATKEEASRVFEEARLYLAASGSTWDLPVFHQYAALSIYGLEEPSPELLQRAASDLSALEKLAAHCPENFEHRTHMLRGEQARISGDADGALRHFESALEWAQKQDWVNDIAVIHKLCENLELGRGNAKKAESHAAEAQVAFRRWGAVACLT